MSISLSRLLHVANRPPVVEDVNRLVLAPEGIALAERTVGLEHLNRLPPAAEVWLLRLSRKQLDVVLPRLDPEILNWDRLHEADCGALGSMSRLRGLALQWGGAQTDLRPLARHDRLETLALLDLPKLHDLSPLAALPNLRALAIEGGMGKPIRIGTLKPLASLTRLEELRLTNLRVDDDSLRPLAALTNLKTLVLSNQFDTAEYARLSIALPRTQCDLFQPWTDASYVSHDASGVDATGTRIARVMVTGRRKPFLDPVADRAKLDRHAAVFETLQEAFRRELASP